LAQREGKVKTRLESISRLLRKSSLIGSTDG
jgi:hypothetical protein